MVSVRTFILASAATLIGGTAWAADMSLPPPQYQAPLTYQAAPAPTGGWYLRGDVGVGIQSFSTFDHSQTNSTFVWPPSWQIVQKDLQDTTIFGGGIGYELNNWFRIDVTGEYRTKAMFKAIGSYTDFCAGGGTCFDVTTGNHSAAVFMANAYVDLGTWWCLTPYIGAGVGGAFNQITGVQDDGINSNGTVGFGLTHGDSSSFDLAWNVQAGLAYTVNNNLKIDFSWRYLHLGSPSTAEVFCQNTPACPGAVYTLTNMNSQDFRLGVRWMLQPDVAPVVLPQPPLMSRG